MAIFDGFFDNLQSGIQNPKGNLGDWQHADRLYVNNNFKHAPKSKFLYHVTFYLNPSAISVVPELAQYKQVVGMLVKSSDLPSFSANIETKNKYNRKKNVQTNIEYNPIDIVFHDDNFGTTTALLEAYFKYYYADSYNTLSSDAYGNALNGDTLYKGSESNQYRFGLDNNIPAVPFFDYIEIAQMSRRLYTKYTLVRPILSDWKHDNVDNTDSLGTMENQITVQYDTVLYDRGSVNAGPDGEPSGFGQERYDQTPSPITLLGGGDVGIFGIIGGAGDIVNGNFDSPLQAGIAGVNLVDQAQNLTSEGLRESGLNLASSVLGGITEGDSSFGGVSQITFPKTRGQGGPGDVTEAAPALGGPGIDTPGAPPTSGPGIDTPGAPATTAQSFPADISNPDFDAQDLPPLE